MTDSIRLSVCITTRNRAAYIGQTLETILAQSRDDVEVVVVDGKSTDNTVEVVREIAARHPSLRLLTPPENSGLDRDYDNAVQAARGTYCWLFSDDDWMVPGALAQVLEMCESDPTVVVVDASVWGPDFGQQFERQRLPFSGRRRYESDATDKFFGDCGIHLSFIGGTIVRRDFWLSRAREPYFGSEFIHVGVLFQAPIPGHMIALGEPLVQIRYGVGNWTNRFFDVWMYKWPRLVWSFTWIPESVRRRICPRDPWASPYQLLLYRAWGSYGWPQYREFVRPRAPRRSQAYLPLAMAALPGRIAYTLVRIYLDPSAHAHYLLDRSPYGSADDFARKAGTALHLLVLRPALQPVRRLLRRRRENA